MNKAKFKVLLGIILLLIILCFLAMGYNFYILKNALYDLPIAICLLVLGIIFAIACTIYISKYDEKLDE